MTAPLSPEERERSVVDEREHPELAPILDIVRGEIADEYVTDEAWERLRLALVALLNQRDKYKTLADEVVGDWHLAQRQADRMEDERDEARSFAKQLALLQDYEVRLPWESSSVSEGENNK